MSKRAHTGSADREKISWDTAKTNQPQYNEVSFKFDTTTKSTITEQALSNFGTENTQKLL